MKIAILVLAAVCFARLWLMPLGSSFWVDEMGTVFVVEHGAEDPSLKVAPQVPQSIYYAVVRAVVAGRSEIAYRMPSVAFMALALLFVGLLASRLIHPDAAWFAVFACFALKGIDYEAANARPYAMGMCVAAAALYFQLRWFDFGRLRDAALFVGLAAMLWRVHLIFWPFYAVFALYGVLRAKDRAKDKVWWWRVALAFGCIGILLIPVAMQALALNAQAGQHVVAEEPTWFNLEHSLRTLLVIAAGAGAWIWSRFAGERPPFAIQASAVAWIVAWWLWHPVALFAFSRITGNSVFVPRYTALSLPGTAMAAALAASCFLPSRLWKPAALLMGIGALLAVGDWKEVWPPHHNSDWRAAARAVNEHALPPSTPVICPSPFVEAKPPAWTSDYKMPGFLYAHLLVYPVSGGNIVLFPFATSPEAEDYAAALLEGAIPASRRFVIYGGNGQAHFWRDWFEKRLPGWTNRSLGSFRDVDAVLFEKLR